MAVDGMLDYLDGRPLRGGHLAVHPQAQVSQEQIND